MGFEEIKTGNGIDIKKEEGKSYIFIYQETTQKHGNYKGKETIENHHHVLIDNEKFIIYGFGQLDYKLKSVKKGDLVRVTYLGKSEGYHQCRVEIDKDYTDSINTVKQTFEEENGNIGKEDIPF